ncbi:hypothetical protein TNCT_197241, partial [Trichonephila clavata]
KKEYADISYNFLVGGDGQINEGRGWKAVGAHTNSYLPLLESMATETPNVQFVPEQHCTGLSKHGLESKEENYLVMYVDGRSIHQPHNIYNFQ